MAATASLPEFVGRPIQPLPMPDALQLDRWHDLIRDARAMIVTSMQEVLRRFERDPQYGLIDTKFSLLTGHDFAADDPIRGRNTIFGWIQGRGLESLATHAPWLERADWLEPSVRDDLAARLRAATRKLAVNLQAMRTRNADRLQFMTDRAGRPLELADDGRVIPMVGERSNHHTLTDLFHAKGLARAGQVLGDSDYVAQAVAQMDEIARDIDRNTLLNDQQPLSPNNPVRPVPGRNTMAGPMIGLYAMTTFYEVTGEQRFLEQGEAWLEYILAHHVAHDDRHAPAQVHDVWEFVNDRLEPYRMVGPWISDPGHALEMTGLAFRMMLAGRLASSSPVPVLGAVESLRVHRLSQVLQRCFANGFSSQGVGIVKLFDLNTRTPVNDTMPWWSLPETMRAAALGAGLCHGSPAQQSALLEILRRSFNAFVTHYVRRDLHLMAYQTLGPQGQPIEVIPATPDADPGYHTSMSLMDMLDGLAMLQK